MKASGENMVGVYIHQKYKYNYNCLRGHILDDGPKEEIIILDNEWHKSKTINPKEILRHLLVLERTVLLHHGVLSRVIYQQKEDKSSVIDFKNFMHFIDIPLSTEDIKNEAENKAREAAIKKMTEEGIAGTQDLKTEAKKVLNGVVDGLLEGLKR